MSHFNPYQVSEQELEAEIQKAEGSWRVKLLGAQRRIKETFETTAKFYAENPDKYEKLCTRVRDIINANR